MTRPQTRYASAILSARMLDGVRGCRLLGLALGPRYKTSERLQQQSEDEGRKDVGLAHTQRGKPEVVPQLAKAESDRGHQEDRQVCTAAVGQERIEELRDDEHGQDRHHQPWRHIVQDRRQEAPSGTRRWVVLSELRWVPCLGFPSPVEAGFWSAVRTPGSLTIDCWATRTWPRPSGSCLML